MLIKETIDTYKTFQGEQLYNTELEAHSTWMFKANLHRRYMIPTEPLETYRSDIENKA
jgi:hypothetical protein